MKEPTYADMCRAGRVPLDPEDGYDSERDRRQLTEDKSPSYEMLMSRAAYAASVEPDEPEASEDFQARLDKIRAGRKKDKRTEKGVKDDN